jgi:hypothetical protein
MCKSQRGAKSPVRVAATPMPVAPAVPPPAAVPTPPASLAHQLDRRGGAALGPGRFGWGDGSSLGRDGRESYQAGECGKDRAHFSLQRGCGGQYGQRLLTQPERVRESSAPVPVASGCAMWGSGVRSQVSLCRPSTRLRRGRTNSVRPTSAPALTTTQPARPQGTR